jgi:hypothetical protein
MQQGTIVAGNTSITETSRVLVSHGTDLAWGRSFLATASNLQMNSVLLLQKALSERLYY